jgi:hypothetical protein
MSVNNAPKLFGILFICVLVAILLALNRIDAVAGAGILGTAIGYLAGNGVAAKQGDPIVPVFSDKHRRCPSCNYENTHLGDQCVSCHAPLG